MRSEPTARVHYSGIERAILIACLALTFLLLTQPLNNAIAVWVLRAWALVNAFGVLHAFTASVTLSNVDVRERSLFSRKVILLDGVKALSYSPHTNLEIVSDDGVKISFHAKAANMDKFIPSLVESVTRKRNLLIDAGIEAMLPEDK